MNSFWSLIRTSFWLGTAWLLLSCSVGPDYKLPTTVPPPDWGWKLGEPRDDQFKGKWWELFQDPALNQLEEQAMAANQNLQAAMARVDQSRATARIQAAKFFPELQTDPNAEHFRTAPDQLPPLFESDIYSMPLDFSYEIDLWGRVRRTFEAAKDQAQASVADYYNVMLTLQADVAISYFTLCQLDTQVDILQKTRDLRQKQLDIVSARFGQGLVTELDRDRAKVELSQTQTQLTDAQRQRTNLQDALAVLCGQATPSFHLDATPLKDTPPVISPGLPSSLLERRPDIAEAERQMAAANAQIGVAYAAFFPSIKLTGEAGYSSLDTSSLFDWENRYFTLGPTINLPIFEGGRNMAGLKQARAQYHAAVAKYREQILVAFKDVSDSLNDLDRYKQESISEDSAVASSQAACDLSHQRYQQGLINYLEVVDSERSLLQSKIQSSQILAQRLVASVRLIKALGGGFEEEEIGVVPSAKVPPSAAPGD